jgi:hypothetical protein
VRLHVEHRDPGAGVEQLRSCRGADTACAAGDECNHPVEVHALTVTSRRVD